MGGDCFSKKFNEREVLARRMCRLCGNFYDKPPTSNLEYLCPECHDKISRETMPTKKGLK